MKNIILSALVFNTLSLLSFQVKAQTKAVPYFRNGEAQVVSAFNTPEQWIKEDVWVETTFDSDGDGKLDRMHVFLTRPFQTQTEGLKLPVIYMSSPYFAGTGGDSKKYFWDVAHEIGATPKMHDHPKVKRKKNRPREANYYDNMWIKYGYATVYSSSPGTGFSDGSPTIGGENETLAPKAVIDWLCGRATGYSSRKGMDKVMATWCTGKVGMTGTSYNGSLCLAAAITGVEGLEAIIPIAPVSSWYKYYRSNGLVRSPGGYLGEDMDVLYDFVHSGDKNKRKRNDKEVRDKILVPGQDRITGDFNEFWASRDYLSHIANMKAAMLMSHGFNDWNVMPEQSLRMYEAAKAAGLPAQIYYHQQGHGGPPPFGMMNKWFTRYLHGHENGVENDAKAWIVREGAQFPSPYLDFPDPAAQVVEFFLTPGGPQNGGLQLLPNASGKQEVFTDNVALAPLDLAKAQESNNRLIYATADLKESVRISGTVTVTLKIACDQPTANLSVYLVVLPIADEVRKMDKNIITRGWIDPQNRNSLTTPDALENGKFYEVSFELMPDDQVIGKGERIGLMVFSSDQEFTLHPKAGTQITVDLDGSSIKIPIVGGGEAFGSTF
jgi:X-Pro dipeptidyl-peptidase